MVGEAHPPVNTTKPGGSLASELTAVNSEVPKVTAADASTPQATSAPQPAAEPRATPASAPQPDSAANSEKPSVPESQGASAKERNTGDDTTKAAERSIPPLPPDADELLKEFYQEVKSVDRDNEVVRILQAFKLNPFEQLGITFDATAGDIRKAYRKLSLLVHPDKCSHEYAKSAFEVVNSASKQLADENIRRELVHVLNLARDEVRKARAKEIKNDAAHRLAILLHPDGESGVALQWEGTPEFHAAWKDSSRDLLAKAAFRRQKLTLRLKEEEARIEVEEDETRKQLKANREHHKNWEGNREKRIGNWREYEKNKKPKKAKSGIRPPKLKEEDEDRTFVQRAVGNTGFQPVGKFTVAKPQRE